MAKDMLRTRQFRNVSILILMIIAFSACDENKASESEEDTDTDRIGAHDTGGNDSETIPLEPELTWIAIPGGTFEMGDADGEPDEQPVHTVDVPAFEMTKTEITVAQYRTCVNADVCWPPSEGREMSNWEDEGFDNHPMNYAIYQQALAFCEWVGGRLPSESEWEYAARSAGQNIDYAWGDELPSCELAVQDDTESGSQSDWGCGTGRTMEVCSKPLGNSEQGLCDLMGNVWEWVADRYHGDYVGAPADGSVWDELDPDSPWSVLRGGCYSGASVGEPYNVYTRQAANPSRHVYAYGFRCAR